MSLRSVFANALLCSIALWPCVAAAGTEKVLYSFPAGFHPYSRLDQDKNGALYGTTYSGGGNSGSVFQLSEKHGLWKERDIYTFYGSDNGEYPFAGVLIDNGVLWGTTRSGGSSYVGTVFTLTKTGKTWAESVVHSFAGSDGSNPQGYLYKDNVTGILYGTTIYGGQSNSGTVFSINPSGAFSTIYEFQGGSDGSYPITSLREGPRRGTLIGATASGGVNDYGTVFELTQNGGTWSKSVIYKFTGGTDGSYPGDLGVDDAGDIFGVAQEHGASNCGVVFELMPKGRRWQFSTPYTFSGGDGCDPLGIQVERGTNSIYGTTLNGGQYSAGTLFKLVPNNNGWAYTNLHSFGGGTDGVNPFARPTIDRNTGFLYGTTVAGGQFYGGTVYEVQP